MAQEKMGFVRTSSIVNMADSATTKSSSRRRNEEQLKKSYACRIAMSKLGITLDGASVFYVDDSSSSKHECRSCLFC
jgi:hypothetical protein